MEKTDKSNLADASTALSKTASGHGAATFVERFILAFRLPYVLGCIVVGFGLFGVLDVALSAYATNGDLSAAMAKAKAPNSLLTDLLVTYSFYAPRFMRERLEEAGRSLASLLPDREEGFRRIFGRLASPRPQVITWIVFLVALLLAVNFSAIVGVAPPSIQFNAGPGSALEFFAGAYDILSVAVATLGLSSVVWTYWSITRGIHRFGDAPLQLRPYYEDAFAGLRPVGALALSLDFAYFVFIGLFMLVVFASPSAPTTADIIGIGGFLSGLIVIGLALFFLPLRRLHQRMVGQKLDEKDRLRPKLASLFEDRSARNDSGDLGHMFRLDMMDRKVASMAVWPFDVGILGRLSAIALSVIAILISRIVALIVHI